MTTRHTFTCFDGHTCGNPVRLVAGGAPFLVGATMSEKRQHFIRDYDWIRTALMFEPRGHDMMSGGFLYPPCTDDADVSILFIETSGCLPVCGHGTIGMATFGLENGLIEPKTPGVVNIDAPAGRVRAEYDAEDGRVRAVRIHNVASYLAAADIKIDCPGLGELSIDVAYGGNYYAIIDPQANYQGLESLKAAGVLRFSPVIRELINKAADIAHPDDPTIKGVSHVQWTDAPRDPQAHARNAVFYGERAIDRSPCGTGSSARMAQLAARGKLKTGDVFNHESYIGSLFECRIEGETNVGAFDAVLPSIKGWARQTGVNTIFVDDDDPFKHGFTVL